MMDDNARITMTVGELKRFLYEDSVSETLNRIGLVSEMSFSLDEYTDKVQRIRFQLVENWCLCKWCQLFDFENSNFAHWRTELKGCISGLKFAKIKGKIDKRKTLSRILIEKCDFKDSDMILGIINDKFTREGIEDAMQRNKVAIEFVNGIDGLIGIMSEIQTSVEDYIWKTFGPRPQK